MAFDTGYEAGQLDERKRHEQRMEQLRRLAEAAEAARQGDPGPLADLGRQAGVGDDLLEVADAAGVTDANESVDGGQLVDDLERWLREQD